MQTSLLSDIDFILVCFDLNTLPACIEIEANYECGSYVIITVL